MYNDIQLKTETHKRLEREGWIMTGNTRTHSYYRKGDKAACVSYETGVAAYWTIKPWMESNYR